MPAAATLPAIAPAQQAAPSPSVPVAPVTTLPPDRVLPVREGPVPECNLADLASSLRPPPAGSVLMSRRPPSAGDEASRRARDKTSDYSLFELLALTEYEYAGQCAWNGRPMHVLTFTPPPSFDAQNPVERVMTAMKGTIVIDAGDMQVARAEGTTVAPIAWGAGMVKLRQAHVVLEYGRVHDEIWLPSRDVFEFDSRVLFTSERQRITHVFDDFSRADVQVETEVDYKDPDAPAPPASPAPGK